MPLPLTVLAISNLGLFLTELSLLKFLAISLKE